MIEFTWSATIAFVRRGIEGKKTWSNATCSFCLDHGVNNESSLVFTAASRLVRFRIGVWSPITACDWRRNALSSRFYTPNKNKTDNSSRENLLPVASNCMAEKFVREQKLRLFYQLTKLRSGLLLAYSIPFCLISWSWVDSKNLTC